MSFFSSLAVAGSGLRAERLRVDLATANLANQNSTRTPEGGPYRRRDPVLQAVAFGDRFGSGFESALRQVSVRRIVTDARPPREIFDPSHPDADERGVVLMPNVNIAEEMVNLMSAQRAFEADLTVIRTSREMAERALRLGR